MSTTIDAGSEIPPALLAAAMGLPLGIREKFAKVLFASVDETLEGAGVVSEAWRDEFAKRIEELRSGKVQAVDGHATLLRLRQELRDRHGI